MVEIDRVGTHANKAQAQKPQKFLLPASSLYKSFGGIKAINNAQIHVQHGNITGLIGPNGAGKTTLFNLVSKFITPDRGTVLLDGEPIHHLKPHQIAQHGMVRTFQIARVLSRLSVLDNMLLAPQQQTGENFFQVWLQGKRIRKEEIDNKERAMFILESIGLAEKAGDYAGALSGGQRKLLEIARVLMTNPKLVLLDEPTAGVNPILIDRICEHITIWNNQGISFLIIEHNMDVIMSLCDRVWVLAEGRNLAEGTPTEIQNNPAVLEAYLGE